MRTRGRFETAGQAAGSAAAMLGGGERLSKLWRYVFAHLFAARAEIDADDVGIGIRAVPSPAW